MEQNAKKLKGGKRMDNSRFVRGLEKLKEIDGSIGEQVLASLQHISPDLGKYIVEFAFGDIYCRKGLSLQERELITISSLLTAGGCEPQLEVHIHGALNIGVAPTKIVEACLQCIPYIGFPKVLNAINVVKKVYASKEITLLDQNEEQAL